MASRHLCAAVASAAAFLAGLGAAAPPKKNQEGIPMHREKQIRAAVPDKPRVAPTKKRRVLIFITPPHLMPKDPHKGYCIPYGTCAMRLLGEKTGAFTPVVSDDLTMFLPDKLKQFDAVVLNNTSGRWITPGDAAMEKLKDVGDESVRLRYKDKEAVEKVLRKSLLDFISGGGGIVAYHYAIGANRHWPEFCRILGATYWGHPWNEEVGVKVEEPAHPLVAAFGGKDFRLADEIFQYNKPYDRKKLRVLLSLDTKKTNMGVKWIHRKDNDFALAWVKPYGKGRIFYTSFGHRSQLYWNPKILQFYLDAIQFAAGDLAAPTAPRQPPADPEVRRKGRAR